MQPALKFISFTVGSSVGELGVSRVTDINLSGNEFWCRSTDTVRRLGGQNRAIGPDCEKFLVAGRCLRTVPTDQCSNCCMFNCYWIWTDFGGPF